MMTYLPQARSKTIEHGLYKIVKNEGLNDEVFYEL